MASTILTVTSVPDAAAAIEVGIRTERNNQHTVIIHSNDVRRITKMSRLARAAIVVANGSGIDGLGAAGEGYTSSTIASPTGTGSRPPARPRDACAPRQSVPCARLSDLHPSRRRRPRRPRGARSLARRLTSFGQAAWARNEHPGEANRRADRREFAAAEC